ncbi:MAG: FHA domain-containing protein [Armatimonadetes bacterium]|nr:FHA domain-containing protein [Armatimonadota bacterium]
MSDANRTQMMGGANRTQMLNTDPNRTMMAGAPSMDPNKTMMGSAPTINATVTIKPVQCPVCKTFNPVGVMFCVDCGLIFDRALPADAFGAPAVQVPMLVEQSGREHPLRPGATTIGREGDISLMDSRISRRHAQITNTDGALTLEDLGSSNGTKIDGRAIAAGEKAPLAGGEKISFAGLEVAVQLPGGPSGNATQAFANNKTAAISTAPKKETAPAILTWDGKDFPLKLGANTFGRKADNDVAITDPYISGRHGVIEIAEDGIYVTDTGSTNGTSLNDSKLAPNMRTLMNEDDVIKIGAIQLTVKRAVVA